MRLIVIAIAVVIFAKLNKGFICKCVRLGRFVLLKNKCTGMQPYLMESTLVVH